MGLADRIFKASIINMFKGHSKKIRHSRDEEKGGPLHTTLLVEI